MDLPEPLPKHDPGDVLRCVTEAVLQLIMKPKAMVVSASQMPRRCDMTTAHPERDIYRLPHGHALRTGAPRS